MKIRQTLLLPLVASSLTLGAVSAQANLTPEQLDTLLGKASDYGFTHYEEISFDDGEVEVEGWLGNEWVAEVDFSQQGQVLREERRRRGGNADGMSEQAVRSAVEAATGEGLVRIEEIQTRRGGTIEVEGVDGNGRELEVRVDASSYKVVHVDRD